MNQIKLNALALSALVATFVFSSCQKEDALYPTSAPQGTVTPERNAPVVPGLLVVPAGNSVSYMTYATGYQIYTCTETSPAVFAWVLTAPEATLYSNAGYNGNDVGIHYAGPSWESNSGSIVVGTRLFGVTVDANAIPWLLLGAVSSNGPGVFEGTTYIQRVNTTGGKAPSTGADASTLGQQVRIAYTAEYYFYKAD